MRLAQIGILNYGNQGGGEQAAEIAFAEGSVYFTGAQTWMADQASNSTSERLYAPRIIYHKGKTYYPYPMIQDASPYGMLRMLVFDKDRGFDRPVTFGNVMADKTGVGDTHTVPSIAIFPDPNDSNIEKIYVTQEDTHLTPFDVYRGEYGDYSYFTEAFQIGVGEQLSYAHILTKPDGHPVIWCRGGTPIGDPSFPNPDFPYSNFIVESSNYFEGLASATPKRITENPDEEDLWHYAGIPFGRYRVGNKFYLLSSLRTGSPNGVNPPEIFSRYYLLTTEDFETFSNYEGTYSHTIADDGLITDAILQTNFMYHETDSLSKQGRIPVAGISPQGFFCAIVGAANADGSYLFVYYDQGTWIKKTINIDDIEARPEAAQPGSFGYIMANSQTDIRCVVYIDEGDYVRPHWFKTTDLGDTWEDLGDMAPDITGTTLRVMLPNNIHDIPQNTNFGVWFTDGDDVTASTKHVWCKVAAWGEIQPIPGVTIEAATEMNYDSKGLFHYKATDANITRSGNDVTAMTDLFGLRNATGLNNPQWNGSDAITLTSTSSQGFTVGSPEGIGSKSALTFMAVAKQNTATAFAILNMSDDSATDKYIAFTMGSNGKLSYRITDTSTAIVTGEEDHDDGEYHVVTFVIDGRSGVFLYLDGKLQHFNTTLDNDAPGWAKMGKGPSEVECDSVGIGIRILSGTDGFYSGSFKEMALFDGVLPFEELHARIKMLCDDYGITYQNQFQIPA